MQNKHHYAEILQYLIDGGDICDIEVKYENAFWCTCSIADRYALLIGTKGYKFRTKPKTVIFNGIELPMYETKNLEVGTCYYIPVPIAEEFASTQRWFNDELDARRLERGLVFLKKDDAIAWGKAMSPTYKPD